MRAVGSAGTGNETLVQEVRGTRQQRQLVNFKVDGMERRLTIAASEITIAGAKERLISLQSIQSELNSVQVSAWQDLGNRSILIS